jgi:glycosyltransferase involved in cell wall biosynthesis
MKNPKISVIVPIYNIEKHLPRCLDSIISQTLQNIEIICVNDYSSDNCQSILDQYAKEDARIIVIQHPENKSILQARKSGVQIAKGEYIIFVDGDDALEPLTCDTLYETMIRAKVDICHFPAKVIGISTKTDLSKIIEFIRPFQDKLNDDNVFDACYTSSIYKWSIWNKIYEASLCKKAYQCTSDFYCNMAEDVYTYFIISYFAKTYLGIEGDPLYNYYFGLGMTGGQTFNGLKKLTSLCEQSGIVLELRKFLTQQNASNKYLNVVRSLEKKFIDESISYWFYNLQNEDCADGFDILLAYWGSEKIIAFLANNYYDKQEFIAQKALGSSSLQAKKTAIKKIGVFYHRMRNGGVERVLSLLIPAWIDLGYSVVMFTDEAPTENDFPLPDCVSRVVLPTSRPFIGPINPEEAHQRVLALRDGVVKYDIDVFIHNASSSPMLIYDLLVIKTMGIPTIVSSHETFSSSMYWRDTGILKKVHVYKIADLVVVLTKVDFKFWTLFGINTVRIPNPLLADINNIRPSKLDAPNVIWVGRFSIEKRYIQAVQIFAEVVQEIPEAKLLMLGKGESMAQTNELRYEIERLGLTENVVICGYFKDITHFYSMSSVYLTTSYHESFSMALIESRAYGIPSVAYELPNLDIFDDKKGAVIVPQGDKTAAAKAIVQMLSDQELRTRMGNEARQSTEMFYKNNNVMEEWDKTLNQTILNKKLPDAHQENNEEIYRRMFQSILLHYGYGITEDPTKANTSFTPAFTPGASLLQAPPAPFEILRNFENLTDHPDYVSNYGGGDMIMVHPIDDMPALCRLRNACPAGTRQIRAEVVTTNPMAKPIDYALIVTTAKDLQWQKDIQQFTEGYCSDWVTVPADGHEEISLVLPEPLKSAAHIYLATRLKPGKTNEYCWAHFKNIRMTI